MKPYGTVFLLAVLGLGVAGNGAAQSQSWFKQFKNGKARFKILPAFDKQAVLDKETGLVWELQPSTAQSDWDNASARCTLMYLGNRMGWRLPAVEELSSLVDRSQADPSLPDKHPFLDIEGSYWTASTAVQNHTSPTVAWYVRLVDFSNGTIGFAIKDSGSNRSWCVRGGRGPDGGVNQN